MHDDASQQRASRLTGIALMCAAVACFAMLDTTAKYLNLYMNTLQIVWARYTGAFLFPFIVSNPWTTPGLMRTTRPALQIGRSMLLLGSTMCNFAALRYLQLDEAIEEGLERLRGGQADVPGPDLGLQATRLALDLVAELGRQTFKVLRVRTR